MFDINKLQEKARLAKELVDKGIAKDINDAYKMIEEQGMIDSKGDEFIFKDKKNDEPEKKKEVVINKVNKDIDKDHILMDKIKQLEHEIKDNRMLIENIKHYYELKISDLYDKIEKMNKEIIKITEFLKDLNESEKERKESGKDKKVKKDNEKKDNISIESIFNNSNNRLIK